MKEIARGAQGFRSSINGLLLQASTSTSLGNLFLKEIEVSGFVSAEIRPYPAEFAGL